MSDGKDERDRLSRPGPPFETGETVAFFPAELGPTSMWLNMDFAVIEAIDRDAESFEFHFVDQPNERAAQGFENIVRPTPAYHAWRTAWKAAFERTQDEAIADAQTEDLRLRVLAEHPTHGHRTRGMEPPH